MKLFCVLHDDYDEMLSTLNQACNDLKKACDDWHDLFNEQQQTNIRLMDTNAKLIKSCQDLANMCDTYKAMILELKPDAFSQQSPTNTSLH